RFSTSSMFSWLDEHFSVHGFGLAVLAHQRPQRRREEVQRGWWSKKPRMDANGREWKMHSSSSSIRIHWHPFAVKKIYAGCGHF
ncbi:hypothetical protein, partial [Chthoniobacter flavus]|uniref:hypothetical protein n=1 Tax=Chthoniobacter flavus TaxID=191863 RepID=UPI001A9D43D7